MPRLETVGAMATTCGAVAGNVASPGRASVPWLGTRRAVAKISTVNSNSEVWHPSELACALHMMCCLKQQVRRCARPRNPSSRDLLTKCGCQCAEPWLRGGGPWLRPWEPRPRCAVPPPFDISDRFSFDARRQYALDVFQSRGEPALQLAPRSRSQSTNWCLSRTRARECSSVTREFRSRIRRPI